MRKKITMLIRVSTMYKEEEMRKKITMLMATVLLIGAGCLGSSLAAQRGGGHGQRGSGGPEAFGEMGGRDFGGRDGGMSIPSQRMLSRVLDLTDQQIEELELLKEVAQAAIEPLVDERHELREQLRAALDVEAPDILLVGELVAASRDVSDEIRAIQESGRDNFLAILTDEQIATLEEMQDRRGSRGGFRRGSPGPDEEGF
jgi:Spy/CpxP family protein refolding chaperone